VIDRDMDLLALGNFRGEGRRLAADLPDFLATAGALSIIEVHQCNVRFVASQAQRDCTTCSPPCPGHQHGLSMDTHRCLLPWRPGRDPVTQVDKSACSDAVGCGWRSRAGSPKPPAHSMKP
jgi:hypothetical protein